jgi:hypothetical protein
MVVALANRIPSLVLNCALRLADTLGGHDIILSAYLTHPPCSTQLIVNCSRLVALIVAQTKRIALFDVKVLS